MASSRNSLRLELGVRGVSGAARNLHTYDRQCVANIRRAVRRHGERLKNRTKELTPVDTGHMRDSVQTVYTPDRLMFDTGWDATDFYGRGLEFYPFFVEYGTVHMAGRFPLTRASREVMPEFRADVREAVQQAIAGLSV